MTKLKKSLYMGKTFIPIKVFESNSLIVGKAGICCNVMWSARYNTVLFLKFGDNIHPWWIPLSYVQQMKMEVIAKGAFKTRLCR